MWYCYATELHAYDFVIEDFVIKKWAMLGIPNRTICDDALANMVAAGRRHLKLAGATKEPKFYLSLILIDLKVNSLMWLTNGYHIG